MKIQGDAFTRVQTPPPKCRKYLFHVALTNFNKSNTVIFFMPGGVFGLIAKIADKA